MSNQETVFWKRFSQLCSDAKTSPNAVCKELGLSNATATHWKNGSTPNEIARIAVANHFGVSVDFLMGITDEVFEEPKMFKNNFIKLCTQKGESPSFVCGKIGISPAAFSQWTDDTIPRKVTQQRAADYFGVTVDYLLGKEQAHLPPSNLSPLPQHGMRVLPVYETVSAGFGAQAEDCIIDYLPCFIISESEAENSIAIKVKGDSMYPKIEDGDIIRVVKQDTADDGQIAVVLVDDEGFVKRIHYTADGIELQSINPLYPPMRFKATDAKRISIVGVVRQIIKNV